MNHLLHFAQAQVNAARLQLEAAEKLLENARMEQEIDDAPNWVYIEEAGKRIGLTKNAVYARAKNDWTEGKHYKRERPGKKTRLIFNLAEIQKWMENIGGYNSTADNSEYGSCGTENKRSSRSTSTRPRQTGKEPPACVMKFIKK